MNDKDEIKFAIRYLKQGLKSKRTPPLYEQLMKELGFERKGEVIEKLEKEDVEMKKKLNVFSNESANACFAHNEKSKQLTKAKELLERLLITSCNSDVLNLLPNCSEVLRVRVEAEQFLKENGR